MLERGGENPRGVHEDAFNTDVDAAAPNTAGIFNGATSWLGPEGALDRDRDGVLVLSHTSGSVLHKSSEVAHVNVNGSGPEEPSARVGNKLRKCCGVGTTLMS